MTQDEIIEMAQQCNLIGMRPHLDGIYSEALIAFANLVAAKVLEQRTWVGLTDEEIDYIYTGIRAVHHDVDSDVLCRAVEAKLKEKNT